MSVKVFKEGRPYDRGVHNGTPLSARRAVDGDRGSLRGQWRSWKRCGVEGRDRDVIGIHLGA